MPREVDRQAKIAERGLDASATRHAVTTTYCGLMQTLRHRPYVVLAAAFFAIEYVYNQASKQRVVSCPFLLAALQRQVRADVSSFAVLHHVGHVSGARLQAWAGVLGGDPRYQDSAERWGSADFSTYVDKLRNQADRALQAATPVRSCAEKGPLLQSLFHVLLSCWSKPCATMMTTMWLFRMRGGRRERLLGLRSRAWRYNYWKMALE